ncbi:hypothetical protein ABZ446_29995 [Streptomyces sp. NPDC005813]|uniref:hypothetical protein n=1 Tax=Streptomyces sp. NPDC005813 TaxID=3155592 RepID=UPI0033D7BAA0
MTGQEELQQGRRYDASAHEDDDRPRRGPVLLMTLLVPAVGAAGGQVGSLIRAAEPAGGAILLASAAAAFLLAFAALSLGTIWTINTVAALIDSHRDRRRRERHSGDTW